MATSYAVNASIEDEVTTTSPSFCGRNMVIGRNPAMEERIAAYTTLSIFNTGSGFNFFGSIPDPVEGNIPTKFKLMGSFNPLGSTFYRVAILDPGMVNDLFDEFDASNSDTTFVGLAWNPFAIIGAAFVSKPPSENKVPRAMNQVIVRKVTYTFDYVIKESGDDPPSNVAGPFEFNDLGDPDFEPPANTSYSGTGTELMFDETIEMIAVFGFDGVSLIAPDVAPIGGLDPGSYPGHKETIVDIYGVYNPNLE